MIKRWMERLVIMRLPKLMTICGGGVGGKEESGCWSSSILELRHLLGNEVSLETRRVIDE